MLSRTAATCAGLADANFSAPRVGQLRISAPLVVDTLDPAHPPGTDQPIDGPGHTTSGSHHSVGELTHAQLPAGRFGESDQQFEIGEGNVGVSHQLLIENTLEQSGRVQVSPPGRLLRVAQPPRRFHDTSISEVVDNEIK